MSIGIGGKMSDTKKHREFWMDTDLLDKALDNCDLGDGYSAKVRQYPHRLMIPELTHVIEYSALVEEKQRVKELVELLQKFNKKTDVYLQIYDGDKELFTYKIFANELIKKYGDV